MQPAMFHQRILWGLALIVVLANGQRPHKHHDVEMASAAELWITPNIMAAILVGIVWLTLFFAGFCCLFQVQTPTSFSEQCLTLNKHY
mmetsp:Transcript_108562/g.231875  ORF Transcript_108562/g.231875 Transcript_108562/m.231875 type:complete len:88 (-) Transcript_108562:46-309(-)